MNIKLIRDTLESYGIEYELYDPMKTTHIGHLDTFLEAELKLDSKPQLSFVLVMTCTYWTVFPYTERWKIQNGFSDIMSEYILKKSKIVKNKLPTQELLDFAELLMKAPLTIFVHTQGDWEMLYQFYLKGEGGWNHLFSVMNAPDSFITEDPGPEVQEGWHPNPETRILQLLVSTNQITTYAVNEGAEDYTLGETLVYLFDRICLTKTTTLEVQEKLRDIKEIKEIDQDTMINYR